LWEVGVLGMGLTTPAYPASADKNSRALVLPVFFYRGEVLRADREGVGARVVRTDDYEFDVGFAASLPASSNDVAARQGMPDLGTLVEFGPRLKATLARPTPTSKLGVELPLRAVVEINAGVRDQGIAFEPRVVYETRDIGYGWGFSTSAGLVFGDQRLNRYFYGVDSAYATATRPAYEARSGLIATRFGASVVKSVHEDVRLFAFARWDSYRNSANEASPLYLSNQGTSLGVGLVWTLGRSEQRVRN
jgi:outer membrane scaffolding protein for murein synthesis (MipA/OmpV family)